MEFLPYPHLIATLFNGCAFGPPSAFTQTSAWTWVDHPVSGLHKPIFALLRLGFPPAPDLKPLTYRFAQLAGPFYKKYAVPQLLMVPQLVNTRFQVLFHSPPGVLFTFPSQYSALSVTKEYLALRGGPRFFRQGFSCLAVLWILPCMLLLRVRGFHPLPPVFPVPFHCICMSLSQSEPRCARTPVWAPPLSLAATYGITFVFSSSGYLDVSVHRVPLRTLWIYVRIRGFFPRGFPHSDICGSLDICSSPQLFAAYHVFLRLLVPRHPPCALPSLTCLFPSFFESFLLFLLFRTSFFFFFASFPGFSFSDVLTRLLFFLFDSVSLIQYSVFKVLFLCCYGRSVSFPAEWRWRDSNS